jgi:hypothetical protein
MIISMMSSSGRLLGSIILESHESWQLEKFTNPIFNALGKYKVHSLASTTLTKLSASTLSYDRHCWVPSWSWANVHACHHQNPSFLPFLSPTCMELHNTCIVSGSTPVQGCSVPPSTYIRLSSGETCLKLSIRLSLLL